MSVLKTIKELYPELNLDYLPQNPSVSIISSLESEIQKGRSSEGLKRVKNLVETEQNLMDKRMSAGFEKTTKTQEIRSYTFMNNPSSGLTPS